MTSPIRTLCIWFVKLRQQPQVEYAINSGLAIPDFMSALIPAFMAAMLAAGMLHVMPVLRVVPVPIVRASIVVINRLSHKHHRAVANNHGTVDWPMNGQHLHGRCDH